MANAGAKQVSLKELLSAAPPGASSSRMGSPQAAWATVSSAAMAALAGSTDPLTGGVDGSSKLRKRPLSPRVAATIPGSAVVQVSSQEDKALVGGLGSIIPATNMPGELRHDGRPMRKRFPVLQHWRNERLIFERPQGSVQPSVAGVAEVVDLTDAASIPKPPVKRRRGRLARCLPDDDLMPLTNEIEGPGAALQRCKLQPKQEPGVPALAPQPAAASGSCPHCGRAPNAAAPAQAASLQRMKRLKKEEPVPPSALLLLEEPRPEQPQPPPPLRSCLQPPSNGRAEARRRQAGRGARSISFREGSAQRVQTTMESFAGLGQELWYPGNPVDCNRCGHSVQWGVEGSITGAPNRSRFSQWQVICNACLAERLFADVGVWLTIALAAGEQSDEGDCSMAVGPLGDLYGQLMQLTMVRPDHLSSMLGKEALVPDVRQMVLEKARARLPSMLGGAGAAPAKAKRTAVEQKASMPPAASAKSKPSKAPEPKPAPAPPKPQAKPQAKRGKKARTTP